MCSHIVFVIRCKNIIENLLESHYKYLSGLTYLFKIKLQVGS
jgi:hypothetical protein